MILASGVSGAGKTEAAKLIVRHLSSLSKAAATGTDIQDAILASNTAFEAFGNARTRNNDNSSRFGKFLSLEYNSSKQVCGCHVSQFLLERSRLSMATPGESNFHILYQVAYGAVGEERDRLLLLKDPSSY